MKKLGIPEYEDGQQYFADQVILANKINDLIDLVNSQQEAIEKLEKELSLRPIGAEIIDKGWTGESVNEVATHRTVTLRIPKEMSILEAIWQARMKADNLIDLYDFWEFSDTHLQKAIDEVKGKSNE